MMSTSDKRTDFEGKLTPHLEVLLQFSLWLTKNGRGATMLLREAVIEVYRTWDKSMTEETCEFKLHKIMTRRFLRNERQHLRRVTAAKGNNADKRTGINNRLFSDLVTSVRQRIRPNDKFIGKVNYLAAYDGLPSRFRSAMILSYLEGFSNEEIANLAGVQPHAIELLLERGRRILQEELFAYVMGNI